MYIAPYEEGNLFNHEETRSRKLLLHKKQIKKLAVKVEQEGYTLIPLKVYFVRGRAKVELGVCRGKKNYDKRETIKERDINRPKSFRDILKEESGNRKQGRVAYGISGLLIIA